MQDPILKKIFANPTMVELLARRYRPDLASRIDFSTLRELPNELLSEQLEKRVPDMLFLANCRGESRRVLFHIEFQATSDAEMPLRNLVYAGLAAQKLRRHFRNLGESGALVVVSMVLYHGAGPWNAPITVEDLVPGLTEYVLVRPEAADPDGACLEDIPALVLGLLVPGQTAGELGRRLDALERALEPSTDPQLRERIAMQLRPVLASVYDHSLLKETSPMATMLEVFTEARNADAARARNEGRLEGQARVIVRFAAQRFGPETGAGSLASARRCRRPGPNGLRGRGRCRLRRRRRAPRSGRGTAPSRPILTAAAGDAGERWAFDVILTVRATCQFVTAAADVYSRA